LLAPESATTEQDGDLLEVRPLPGYAKPFDAWMKRNEFFRLRRGDTDSLLAFLRTVGLFERADTVTAERTKSAVVTESEVLTEHEMLPPVAYESKISEEHIWEFRRLIEGSLKALGEHTGKHIDFQVRILRAKDGKLRSVLTTTTFSDALLLTLAVDQMEGAKVRKCARPDCGISFSVKSGHKRKYCEWYCGHIESVRKQRRKGKRAQARGKSALARKREKKG
jgi:hypothetical protein